MDNHDGDNLTLWQLQKRFLLGLRDACANNYITGAEEAFRRSVITLLGNMKPYYESEDEYKRDLDSLKPKLVSKETFFDIWMKLCEFISNDTDIYPTRYVQGVINDDDIQPKDTVDK